MSLTKENAMIPSNVEWSTMQNMAKNLLQSGFLPSSVNTTEKVVAIMQKGRELDVPPMHALSNIIVIQGKPVVNPELMRALIFRDHGDDALLYTHMGSDYCEIEYKRKNAKKSGTMRFTWDDAVAAGLPTGSNGATWKKYPAAMLSARCTSMVGKAMFADSVGGMYTPDEFDLPVDEDGQMIVGAIERQREPPNRAQGMNPPTKIAARASVSQDASTDTVNADEITGEIIEDDPDDDAPAMIAPATLKRLWATFTEMGWTPDDVSKYLEEFYPHAKQYDAETGEKRQSTKMLSEAEAQEIIAKVTV